MSKFYAMDIDNISGVLTLFDSNSNILLEKKCSGECNVLKKFEVGDKVLGYCKSPISEVKYGFEIMEKNNNDNIILRKCFEVYNGCKVSCLDDVIKKDFEKLDQKEKVIQLTEENYNIVYKKIFTVLESNNIDANAYNKSIELYDDVKQPYNRIIFGAPGTGKSYKLNKDIEDNKLKGLYKRVTFHPNYTYAQFVGSYKPVSRLNKTTNQKEVVYEFVPGPFLKVLVDSLKDEKEGKSHLLIIEEINRANPAAVFGDVFQLLDRDKDGQSSYTVTISKEMKEFLQSEEGLGDRYNHILGEDSEEIYIPNNMYIWATMNSADQGVYPMDSAFKRRWSFEYIGIDDNEDSIEAKDYNTIELKNEVGTYSTYKWNDVRKAINKQLKGKVNEDKLLGPFFLSETELIKGKVGNNEFDNIFKSKVLMYLYEDILKHKKNIKFFGKEVNGLSDVMGAYDDGKAFCFDIKPIQNNMGNEVTVGEEENRYNMPTSKEMQLAEEKAKYDE